MELKQFLQDYAQSGISRFHMPGHKGNFPPLLDIERLTAYDITEIDGADYLFQSSGLLKRLEERAARFYGVYGTAISTGGSTLCIQAMLATAFREGDKVIAVRNAHAAFINACALLDLHPVWVMPDAIDSLGVSGAAEPSQIEAAFEKHPDAKGVYLTSPDYFGNLSDIAAISKICRQHNVPLVVDNAHGAALKLAQPDLHPMSFGADLCCDSAHKTLPVLTGGAFLHYNTRFSSEKIKSKMALFGSTSPSYLTMLSIDLCMDWLEKEGTDAYANTAEKILKTKRFCLKQGIPFADKAKEPFRLAVCTGAYGWADRQAGEFFRRRYIEPEYIGGGYVVLMASPFNTPTDWERLNAAVAELFKFPIKIFSSGVPAFALPEAVLSPREAVFSDTETVKTEEAEERIAAQTVISCPPGVPVAIPGEKITAITKNILKNCGIFALKVVK